MSYAFDKYSMGGGTAETPVFDLTALGVPDVSMDGTPSAIETDTTEIISAIEKGVVKFIFSVNGETVSVIPNNINLAGGQYVCSAVAQFDGFVLLAVIVMDGIVGAVIMPMGATEKVATNIDLSAYETDGQIVETYSDGTTKTTTVEFDENGNPIKITDGDGNVTELTW